MCEPKWRLIFWISCNIITQFNWKHLPKLSSTRNGGFIGRLTANTRCNTHGFEPEISMLQDWMQAVCMSRCVRTASKHFIRWNTQIVNGSGRGMYEKCNTTHGITQGPFFDTKSILLTEQRHICFSRKKTAHPEVLILCGFTQITREIDPEF